MDKPGFNPELLKLSVPLASPKTTALFEKIAALDAKDMEKEGKVYKHMIFTDLNNSAYGLKLLASSFTAEGFRPAFHVQGQGFTLVDDRVLKETEGKNFAVLASKKFFDRSMTVHYKKSLLEKYNERPHNVHGDLIRFIILDQGFKEGIDLFDIKYVHLFEPLVVVADEKQAIGRGTRFCGQKGLIFHPRFGWPLFVFRYDVMIPDDSKYDAETMAALHMKYNNIDVRRVVFASQLEEVSKEAAVDHALTAPIHQFKIETPPPALAGGSLEAVPPSNIMKYGTMSAYIRSRFMKFKYPDVKLQNMCGGSSQIVSFTPTQDFIRHYFQPSSAYKGMLLYHSVGTGKTCTAIATATTSFEKKGYNILWVTRHTLKSDIWKNMYRQVCSLVIQEKMKKRSFQLPAKISGPMKYVSDRWMEPMSYKQFSNMLLKQNKFYEEIIRRNGNEDPLRKTLIIIDEAHKLYAPNVAASERPRTDILEKMIHNSYKKSGDDSCRVLLMTATPFTEDGMEMMKLLNLLRPLKSQLPTDFDKFSRIYLDVHGKFTKSGVEHFRNDVSGYISYLNRSADARNFSHPVLENVLVPMTMTPESTKPSKFLDLMVKDLQTQMKETRSENKEKGDAIKEKIRAWKTQCREGAKKRVSDCKEEVNQQYQTSVDAAKDTKEAGIEDCKSRPRNERKACKEEVMEEFKAQKVLLMEEKKANMAECAKLKACDEAIEKEIKAATDELEEQKKKVETLKKQKTDIKEEIAEAMKLAREYKEQLNTLKPNVQNIRNRRKALKEQLKAQRAEIAAIEDKEARKVARKQLANTLGKEAKELEKEYHKTRGEYAYITTQRRLVRAKVGRASLGDLSQETALKKKCRV